MKRQLLRLARFVNKSQQEPREADPRKGTMNMPAYSVKRTIIAISAALTVSALTIGATVGPAQAGTLQVSVHAHG